MTQIRQPTFFSRLTVSTGTGGVRPKGADGCEAGIATAGIERPGNPRLHDAQV